MLLPEHIQIRQSVILQYFLHLYVDLSSILTPFAESIIGYNKQVEVNFKTTRSKRELIIDDPDFDFTIFNIRIFKSQDRYTDALPKKGMFLRNKMSRVEWHLSVSVLKAS